MDLTQVHARPKFDPFKQNAAKPCTVKPLFTVPLFTVSLYIPGLIPFPRNILNQIFKKIRQYFLIFVLQLKFTSAEKVDLFIIHETCWVTWFLVCTWPLVRMISYITVHKIRQFDYVFGKHLQQTCESHWDLSISTLKFALTTICLVPTIDHVLTAPSSSTNNTYFAG